MVSRQVWLAIVGVAAMAGSGVSAAQQYRAGEFLNLDLSRAVLSPKPLGPAARFVAAPSGVIVDPAGKAAQASVQGTGKAKAQSEARAPSETRNSRYVAHAPAVHAPRKLVHLGRNPADAKALDTRIQVWPCKSGGICSWKR